MLASETPIPREGHGRLRRVGGLAAVAVIAFGVAFVGGKSSSKPHATWNGPVPVVNGRPAAVELTVPPDAAAVPKLKVPIVKHTYHPTYTPPPVHTYTPPVHTYTPPVHTYTPPTQTVANQ